MAQTYVKGNLYQISIIDFKPDPNQPRKVIDPDALAELAASIQKHGILQPLLFRVGEQGFVYIVAGERRYLAAQQIGLLVLPAICVEGNYAEIALVENLQRQDLTSVEEAEALQRLMNEQSYTQEQLGEIVGKARTTVSEILTINRLPQTIRDECRGDRQITRQTLIAVSRKKQERGMITAYNAYRVKQQKVKGSRQKRDPNDHAASLEIAQKVGMKIGNLDTAAWTDDERESFRVTLVDLKNKIDGFLNPNPMLA
jgi:ParB family chromosome partitioning protein